MSDNELVTHRLKCRLGKFCLEFTVFVLFRINVKVHSICILCSGYVEVLLLISQFIHSGVSERDDDFGNRLRLVDTVSLPGATSAGATGGIDAFVMCPGGTGDTFDWEGCVSDVFACDADEASAPRKFYEGRVHNALVHEHRLKQSPSSSPSGSVESSLNCSGVSSFGASI